MFFGGIELLKVNIVDLDPATTEHADKEEGDDDLPDIGGYRHPGDAQGVTDDAKKHELLSAVHVGQAGHPQERHYPAEEKGGPDEADFPTGVAQEVIAYRPVRQGYVLVASRVVLYFDLDVRVRAAFFCRVFRAGVLVVRWVGGTSANIGRQKLQVGQVVVHPAVRVGDKDQENAPDPLIATHAANLV